MNRFVLACVFIVVLVADLYTKHLAQQMLVLGEPVEVIAGLFNFTLVYNPGAAFGLFGDLSPVVRRVTLATVSLIALCVIFRFLVHEAKDDAVSRVALVAVLGGALGNIVDRIRYDAVVDFLDFYWGSYHWPAFNIADSAICVGVAVLVVRIIFAPKPEVVEIDPETDVAGA